MTQDQQDKLNLEQVPNHVGTMFLFDIPLYKVKAKNIWIAQYDFRSETDLRERDLYCVYGYTYVDGFKKNSITHFSQTLLDDGHEMYIQSQIDNLFKVEA